MQRGTTRVLSLLAVLSIAAAACGTTATSSPAAPSSGTGATPIAATPAPSTTAGAPAAGATLPPTDATVYPRNQTLYTSGKQWGAPSTWNPFNGNAAMGVVGLQYETLFLYDPIKDTYTPWLATNTMDAGWDSAKTTYTIAVRQGVNWSDGSALTAAAVAFSLNIYKDQKTTLGSNLFDMVNTVTASGNNVVVTFKGTPSYQEFASDLYNFPIVPAAVWQAYDKADDGSFLNVVNMNGVGSGPYMYKTAAQDRMVWVKNPAWWASAAAPAGYGLTVGPTYVVDLVNSSNNAALSELLSGGLDLDNNYLPGIAQLISSGTYPNLATYYASTPYMLAGNTAWLVPNTKHKPLDDAAFRKALAESITPADVVNKDYGGIVSAADPTGLLPVWDKYIDHAQTKTFGSPFNLSKAITDLAAAGYRKGSDTSCPGGCVINKDGSAINLKLEVPDGWSDWMEAENLIAADAAKAGIKITPSHPADAVVVSDEKGASTTAAPTFDLVIDNSVQIGNTPWVYYDYIFHQPQQATGAGRSRNLEQFDSPAAWKLVQQLDQTPTSDATAMANICSQIQKIQLTTEPIIPLWYNGEWSQVSNTVWTNWPSSTGNQIQPATWNGYWQMGAIYMLTNIKLVPPAS